MKVDSFKYSIYSELLKIMYSKGVKIVASVVLFLQPFLAYISSKQILSIGLDATPETNSSLLEAIPPIEYTGFDSILLGLFGMIILGATLGSLEYKNSSLRESILFNPNKIYFFVTKFIVTLLFIFTLSLISIFLSIASSHYALGDSGLNPFVLNGQVWSFILLGTISWTLLTILSFMIGFLFKSSVVALLFLIPQLYNLGNFLADRVAIAKLLPVALAHDLIASSPTRMSNFPAFSIFFLILWVLIILCVAFYKFLRTDIGNG